MHVLIIQVIFVCRFMIAASFKLGNFCWLLNLLFYCYTTFLQGEELIAPMVLYTSMRKAGPFTIGGLKTDQHNQRL